MKQNANQDSSHFKIIMYIYIIIIYIKTVAPWCSSLHSHLIKWKVPSLILGEDTKPFGVASGRASGVKNLPDQTCGSTCCGDPWWITEQPKAVSLFYVVFNVRPIYLNVTGRLNKKYNPYEQCV